MCDEAVTPEEQQRNRRLFNRVIGWMLTKGRPPGMIGEAVGFRGRTPSGPAQLHRAEGGWTLVESDGHRELGTLDVLREIVTDGFFPRRVEVVPDLAELLFMEAVYQAQESVHQAVVAARATQEVEETSFEDNPLPWLHASSALDRAVRASIASIVLAIAAAEAQLNRWATAFGGWGQDEDRLGAAEKCEALAKKVGHGVNLGRPPYQQLHEAMKRRNRLVHSAPLAESVPVTGIGAWRPGMSMSLEARGTCLAVRSSLVDLARRLGELAPPYLAYCPPVSADDDTAWSSAYVMTGARHDPDFPPASAEPSPPDHAHPE